LLIEVSPLDLTLTQWVRVIAVATKVRNPSREGERLILVFLGQAIMAINQKKAIWIGLLG
jgi:hypothetical protein